VFDVGRTTSCEASLVFLENIGMPPKAIPTDKLCLMLYYQNAEIPKFASDLEHFEAMWDGDDYSQGDRRSIYESVLLVVLRKVCGISDQEQLEHVMLEMALVKFLAIWLQWGESTTVEPALMEWGPNAKKDADPADIAMFGDNREFLQSITDITDAKTVEYMKAAGMSVASVTKAAANSMPQKMSKPTATDIDKVSAGLSHSDNVAIRDPDSTSVKEHIAKAIELKVDGTPTTVTQQYQFLVQDPTCYALVVLGFRLGLKVDDPRNMEFLLGHMSSAQMWSKSLLLN
jgi:hypothetical protein